MGLTAAEVRLEVDDGHPSTMRDPVNSLAEQLAKADGQVCPSEELDRLGVCIVQAGDQQ